KLVRFAFWNIAKNWNARKMLPTLASEQDLDLILLAEAPEVGPAEIHSIGGERYRPIFTPLGGLRVHSRMEKRACVLFEESFRYSFLSVQLAGKEDFMLCLVHQPALGNKGKP